MGIKCNGRDLFSMSKEVGKHIYVWVGKILKDKNVFVGSVNRECKTYILGKYLNYR